MNNYSIKDIDTALEIIDVIRSSATHNPKFGFDDDWVIFMKKMRILTPQSSGNRIQNYIFNVLGWDVIPSSLNKGDIKNSLGQYLGTKSL